MAGFILYLDSEFLQVFQSKQKRWTKLAGFPRTREGHQAFALFLQSHPKTSLTLLANLPHEHIVQESIPDIRGKDRQSLIQRRLEQHFPDNPFRLAEPAEAGENASADLATGKVGWQLSAFARHEDLLPWLDVMTRVKAHLLGIYSVTQLNGTLLNMQQANARPCLLLVRDGKTLRQYFVRGEQTSLCRHLMLPDEETDFLLRESEKLQQFLINQHQIKRDEALTIYLLGFSRDEAPDLPLEMLLVAPDQPLVELYLNTFKKNRPRANFAPSEYLQATRLARISLATTLTTAVFALGSMAFSMVQWVETDQQIKQTHALNSEIRQFEVQSTVHDSSKAPVSLTQLRQIIQRHKILTAQQHGPERLMIWLSQALDRYPGIKIEALEWRNEEGQERLLIEGRSEGQDTRPAQKILDDFVANLSVDRSIPVRLMTSGDAGKSVMRGSSEQPFSANIHLRFTLEAGAQP